MSIDRFTVTPDELSGVAAKLTALADRLLAATTPMNSIDTSGLAHAEPREALQVFLSGWTWGAHTLHDELLNLAKLMSTAAENYDQLDSGLAALASGGSTAAAQPENA